MMLDKVFVISLHRTGTKSVTSLLANLGYKAIHWPGNVDPSIEEKIADDPTDHEKLGSLLAKVVADHDAFSDVPFPVLYRYYAAEYPTARFVLAERPAKEWIGSVRRKVRERRLNPFEKTQYWHYLPNRPEFVTEIDVADLTSMCNDHSAQAVEFFKEAGRESDLLRVNLDSSAGRKIAEFLGHASDDPLPWIQRRNRVNEARAWVRRTWRRLAAR